MTAPTTMTGMGAVCPALARPRADDRNPSPEGRVLVSGRRLDPGVWGVARRGPLTAPQGHHNRLSNRLLCSG